MHACQGYDHDGSSHQGQPWPAQQSTDPTWGESGDLSDLALSQPASGWEEVFASGVLGLVSASGPGRGSMDRK